MMRFKFTVGQRVRKKGGYPFPGVVEAAFTATQIDGTVVDRYVVNQTAIAVDGERPTGLLHIFAPEQLEEVNGEEYVGPHVADAKGAYTQEMTDQFTAEQWKDKP
jgi:hypothetical protein